MSENTEKIRKERIKNIVHLVRLSPERDQDEMVNRFTKGEPPDFVEAVKTELSRFEMEFVKVVTSDTISSVQDNHMMCITVGEDDKDELYIKVFSYDVTKKHSIFNKMLGKKIKVIIREIKN